MHCLSAREYRVGVDVVADAVQVFWSSLILPFHHHWSYHLWFDPCDLTIWSCQAALNAELAEIRRIQTSMAQVGKLDGVWLLNPIVRIYQTLDYLCVSTDVQLQQWIRCIFNISTDLSTTTTYRELSSWWARYNSFDLIWFKGIVHHFFSVVQISYFG